MSGSIRIPTPASAEDLRGEQYLAAENDGAAAGDDPFDLDGVAGLDGWQRRRAGVDRAARRPSRARSVDGQVRSDRLDPGPPMNRWIKSNVGPEPDELAGRTGPSQNCRPASCMFPEAGTTRSNSTAPPAQGAAATELVSSWTAPSSPAVVSRPTPEVGAAASVGGSQTGSSSARLLRDRGEPVRRADRHVRSNA